MSWQGFRPLGVAAKMADATKNLRMGTGQMSPVASGRHFRCERFSKGSLAFQILCPFFLWPRLFLLGNMRRVWSSLDDILILSFLHVFLCPLAVLVQLLQHPMFQALTWQDPLLALPYRYCHMPCLRLQLPNRRMHTRSKTGFSGSVRWVQGQFSPPWASTMRTQHGCSASSAPYHGI